MFSKSIIYSFLKKGIIKWGKKIISVLNKNDKHIFF